MSNNGATTTWHGLVCPKCGEQDDIRVQALIWCDLTENGSVAEGDHEWGRDSEAECRSCLQLGKAEEFQPENEERVII